MNFLKLKRKGLINCGFILTIIFLGCIWGTVTVFASNNNIALQQQIQKLNPYRYYQADYNKDGKEEAFVITDIVDNGVEDEWRAKIYFVTENGSKLIKNNDKGSWLYTLNQFNDSITNEENIWIAESNGYKAFCIYVYPVIGINSNSYVFTVNKNGEPIEHKLLGRLDKNMTLWINQYDREYIEEGLPDNSSSYMAAATDKPYFFYMDNEGNLKEYGAIEITKDQFLLFDGANEILNTIENEGDIKQILYRANGYIQINARENTSRFNYLIRYDNDKVYLLDDSGYNKLSGKSNFTTGYIRYEYESENAVKPEFMPPAKTVSPSSSNVKVNGKTINFDCYNINGSTYFKLRDIAMAINGTKQQFNVVWDENKNAVNLISGTAYEITGGELQKGDGTSKKAYTNNSKIYKDGNLINLEAYVIGGNNYFKLRDLGETFGFGVNWDSATNTIIINTTK